MDKFNNRITAIFTTGNWRRGSLAVLSLFAATACDNASSSDPSLPQTERAEETLFADAGRGPPDAVRGPPVSRADMVGEIVGETPEYVRTLEFDRSPGLYGGAPIKVRSYNKSGSLIFNRTFWPNGDERLERTEKVELIGTMTVQAPDCAANNPLPPKALSLLRPDKDGPEFPKGAKWDVIDPVTWKDLRERACAPHRQQQQQEKAEEERKTKEQNLQIEQSAQESQRVQDEEDRENERLLEAVRQKR
jgi:hypothetical protein